MAIVIICFSNFLFQFENEDIVRDGTTRGNFEWQSQVWNKKVKKTY